MLPRRKISSGVLVWSECCVCACPDWPVLIFLLRLFFICYSWCSTSQGSSLCSCYWVVGSSQWRLVIWLHYYYCTIILVPRNMASTWHSSLCETSKYCTSCRLIRETGLVLMMAVFGINDPGPTCFFNLLFVAVSIPTPFFTFGLDTCLMRKLLKKLTRVLGGSKGQSIGLGWKEPFGDSQRDRGLHWKTEEMCPFRRFRGWMLMHTAAGLEGGKKSTNGT